VARVRGDGCFQQRACLRALAGVDRGKAKLAWGSGRFGKRAIATAAVCFASASRFSRP
jgi:hypothetical protein